MLIYNESSLKIAFKFTLLFFINLLTMNITPSNLLLITINLDRMVSGRDGRYWSKLYGKYRAWREEYHAKEGV